MTDDFSPAAYAALLEHFLALRYESRQFKDAEPSGRHLILRHDLDMSLQAAERIAEIEHDTGVSAEYFILLDTEMYNIFSRRSRRSLSRILALGGRIGLHFDASAYGEDLAAMDRAARHECNVIEQLIGAPVRTISFHRPAQRLLGLAQPLAGRLHAYMPRFFEDMGYCSDSQGRWRFGLPLDHVAVAEGRALQLLTHPIWWQEPGGLDPVERLERFAATRGMLLRDELSDNCIPFRAVHRPADAVDGVTAAPEQRTSNDH